VTRECSECGKLLAEFDRVCGECGTPAPGAHVLFPKCVACDTLIPKGSHFCLSCGAVVAQEPPPAVAEQEASPFAPSKPDSANQSGSDAASTS